MKLSLLFQETPCCFPPSLAASIGLNQAIVLQTLYYLLRNPKCGRTIGGERYVWNSVRDWKEQFFPFFSEDTITRTLEALEARGFVKAVQADGFASRRYSYTINEQALNAYLTHEMLANQKGEIAPISAKSPNGQIAVMSLPQNAQMSLPQNAVILNKDTAKTRRESQPAALPLVLDGVSVKPPKTKPETKPSLAPLKNALAVVDGSNLAQMTPSAWGRVDRALKDIRTVCPDVTPEEITRRAQNYRLQHPDATISPTAVSANWAKLGNAKPMPSPVRPTTSSVPDNLR